LQSFGATQDISSDERLEPLLRHENIGETVTHFIQRSHYNHTAVDDALSSRVLDRYIESLDGNRMYLLEKDVEYFDQYRYKLDDMVKSEPLDPVYEMFEVYRTRVRERYNFALKALETEPDFSIDESFQFDRSEAPWLKTSDELDEVWRKRVKSDALRHILNDKTWEETKEILTKRYQRLLRRMDQVNSDDVFEGFMNAFAHTLDPHSSYLSPRNSEEYRIQMSLSYFGIGASLQPDDDYVKVIGIIPGGPAAIDGELKPNDLITGVADGSDGEMIDVVGWRLEDVVDKIRGPGDTIVRLQILPADALPGSGEKIISLTRGQVKLEEQAAKSEVITVPSDGREWRIGVIDVPSFYRDYRALTNGDKDFTSTTRDVKRLIEELEAEGIDGLVMDLRGNGGGHLTEATALSGLFIDNGPVVQLRNASGRINRLDDPNPIAQVAYDGPLAVLVDRFSASASEIFAAAIQDYARGVIIGQQTFGKGTVQNLYSLDQYMKPDKESEDGFGQLTLTIGKYYRVTGESTQHRGVNPDIALPSAIDAEEVGESVRDSALPWDTIKTARFSAGKPLDTTIQSLIVRQDERSKADPDFQWLLGGIQEFEEARSQDSVSLNMAVRKTEREEELARRLTRENERRAARNLEPLESLDDIDEDDVPDVLLQQAADIVKDMAEIRTINTLPAQTASVEP
jgi:carboxyl-terminal processing protease